MNQEKISRTEAKVKEVIKMRENFPVDGEAYAIGRAENGKYFYAWGSEYPYADEVPICDILSSESGISWHNTKEEAFVAMSEAVEAVENN